MFRFSIKKHGLNYKQIYNMDKYVLKYSASTFYILSLHRIELPVSTKGRVGKQCTPTKLIWIDAKFRI